MEALKKTEEQRKDLEEKLAQLQADMERESRLSYEDVARAEDENRRLADEVREQKWREGGHVYGGAEIE